MEETKEKYVVADGCSFVGNRKSYKAGDEIDESAFSDKKRFESFLTCDPPKIVKAPAGAKKETEDDAGDENPTTDRQTMEKLAAELGMKPENIAKLDDKKLFKVWKKQGKIT
jgi:hypothetical protein